MDAVVVAGADVAGGAHGAAVEAVAVHGDHQAVVPHDCDEPPNWDLWRTGKSAEEEEHENIAAWLMWSSCLHCERPQWVDAGVAVGVARAVVDAVAEQQLVVLAPVAAYES